jgi:hypothetical protein
MILARPRLEAGEIVNVFVRLTFHKVRIGMLMYDSSEGSKSSLVRHLGFAFNLRRIVRRAGAHMPPEAVNCHVIGARS